MNSMNAPEYESGAADEQEVEIRTEELIFKRISGIELGATVHYPPDWERGDKRGGIIFFGGGGWRGGGKELSAGLTWQILEKLLEEGCYIASINYRIADPQVKFPAPANDCKDALRRLKKHASSYGYDSERMAAMGNSAGGHFSLLCAFSAEGDFKEDRSLEDIAAPVKCAVSALLVHGDQDAIVPVEQSRMLCERSAELGASIEYIEVKGAGHGQGEFSKEGIDPSFSEISKRCVGFIKSI